MAKKYRKEELFEMPAVEVYRLVLEGKIIKKFPNGFWQQPEALENAKLCVKFMIEEILNWNSEYIKEKISSKIFKENKLSGMLEIVFKCSPYIAINTVYPNKFKEWEFKATPQGFWTLGAGIEATKWLIEEKLKWTEEDIKGKLSYKIFSENKLNGMLSTVLNNSPYSAINAAYPNKFKEWELKQVPQNFWTLENGIEATKWLIEEQLKWTDEDIKEKILAKTFKENSLSGMLQYVFNSSPYKAINAAYPNRFKQWELKNVPLNFWTLETGAKATKWLIEEKLKWTDAEIKEKLSYKIFAENGLSGILQYVFGGSPYSAINAVYPNRFKQWEFKNISRDFWILENGIKATKWLIEEKLKWTDAEIKEKLSYKIFAQNGLSGMLQYVFNNSPFDAIDSIYPGEFKKEDLKSYQNNFVKKQVIY